MYSLSRAESGMLQSISPHFNTLHTLSVGYTLVSLGALDEEGYKAHISGSYLKLIFLHSKHIDHIACTYKRLYKVSHPKDSANAVKMLTIMELHQ